MKQKTDMTPGVVGTALAAVAAGSLVLFSLVLQQSAFIPSSTNGLKALSPADRGGQKIIVEAAPEENDSAGEATVAETTGSEETSAPTTGTESFSPIPEDDDIVAEVDDPADNEFPNASGGTENTVNGAGIGATANARGPQATISKDPNGRPGDVTLPDRNGPKNTAPPHGSNPDRGNDDSDGRADRDEPRNDRQKSWSKDRAKNDRQKSWSKDRKNDRQKSWAKNKHAKNDKSRDKSSREQKNKSSRDKPRNSGKNNDDEGDRDRSSDNDGDREDHQSEDRNDRHDSRRDSDEDDDRDDDDDDDDDRHDDSHQSNDDSRGHSGSRDSKH